MALYLTFALALFGFTSGHAGRVLLTLYALKLGAPPFVVGTLAATFAALPTVLSWQAGRLADRFGSRWTLLFSAACAALGMLVPYYMPGMPALYVAATMNGVLLSFCGVSLQNLVGLQSNPQNRAKNFSNYSMINSAANFIAPLFTGFSIDRFGHAATCLELVLLSAVAVGLLVVWGGALPGGSGEAVRAASIRDQLADSRLWWVLGVSSLVMTGVTLYVFYMPVYASAIGMSASVIGVVLAMYSAAAFVVRMILPWLIARGGEVRVLAYAFFLAASGFLLVPCFRSPVLLGLVSFLFGLGIGCGQPITIMMTFSNSTEGRSGEALGVRITVMQLTNFIVPVIFGAIGSVGGVFPVFWLNAAMLVSGGAMAIRKLSPGTPART